MQFYSPRAFQYLLAMKSVNKRMTHLLVHVHIASVSLIIFSFRISVYLSTYNILLYMYQYNPIEQYHSTYVYWVK